MAVPITLPDLGTDAAVFSLWHVVPGERVFEGDRVAEILLPGVVFDVAAPATGTLSGRVARPRDRVAAGQILGTITPDPDV